MPAKQTPQVPPAEKVEVLYRQLSKAAASLNAASDELGKAIGVLEAALARLNLGVSAWVRLSGGENNSYWWSRDVGYAKVGQKWGIALRKREGDYQYPDQDSEETWLFNDGPRWMRAGASAKIPDLLEALLEETDSTTKKIKDRSALVYELVAAMSKAVSEAQPPGEVPHAAST